MLRIIRHVIAAGLFLSAYALAAQPSSAPVHGLRFDAPPALQATRPNGMFVVTGMAEDASGFMWLSTEKGLMRFDGRDARTYRAQSGGFASNLLFNVVTGDEGRLWVSDEAGRLFRFDPLTGWADRVGFPTENTGVLAYAQTQDGTLWIGTQKAGLFRLNPGNLEAETVHLTIRYSTDSLGAVIPRVDPEGRIWIAVEKQGLFLIDSSAGDPRPIALPGTLLSAYFNFGLDVDRHGRVNVLTDRGLLRYDTHQGRFVSILEGEKWPSLNDSSMYRPFPERLHSEGQRWFVDSYDRLWVGSSETPGLVVLDLQTGSLSRYEFRPDIPWSVPSSPTITFSEDRTGGVWVSTFSGLRHVAPLSSVFHHITLPETDRSVRLALDREGQLLAGVFCGRIFRLETENGIEELSSLPLNIDDLCTLTILQDRRGAYWIATFASDRRGGLHRVDSGGGYARYTHIQQDAGSLPHALLRVIHEDREGRIWVGTEGGLARYEFDTDSFERVHVPDDAWNTFGNETIWTISDGHAGTLWVGTFEEGLVHYEPGTGRARRYRHDPENAQSLPSDIISDVIVSGENQDAVWVSTYDRGFARLNPSTGHALRFSTEEGLPSNGVRSLAEDRDGNIWASTEAGLVRLDPLTGDLRVFSEADGLLSTDFSLNAGVELPDGRLAFATSQQVVIFDPSATDIMHPAAPLALTALHVYDAERPVEAAPREIRLAPDDDFFSVEYAALGLAAGGAHYRYRLLGFDREWIEVGTRRAATYTNVPPGRYTLHIEANLGDGWGRNLLAVPVVVEPAWWEMLWVRVVAGLIVLGVVIGGTKRLAGRKLRRRLAVLEAERVTEQALQNERARISADVHDHVGASLTRIQLLSDLLRRGRNDHPGVYLDKIAVTTRKATQDLDAIVWAVDPTHDGLDAFADYLCAYTAEFCEDTELRCRFDRPDEWPEGQLQAEIRYPAFVAVKEALSNVARHARATTVRLRFLSDADTVTVEVEDDGQGFDPQKIDSFANGVRTMTQRAERAGGELSITSAENGGTCVRIVLPVRKPSP